MEQKCSIAYRWIRETPNTRASDERIVPGDAEVGRRSCTPGRIPCLTAPIAPAWSSSASHARNPFGARHTAPELRAGERARSAAAPKAGNKRYSLAFASTVGRLTISGARGAVRTTAGTYPAWSGQGFQGGRVAQQPSGVHDERNTARRVACLHKSPPSVLAWPCTARATPNL